MEGKLTPQQIEPMLAEMKSRLDEASLKVKEVPDELEQVRNVNELLKGIAQAQDSALELISKI